ncbi:tetratricopeptide domain protein [Pseudodesulfovibrio aespoeensis Aspo-2]|uniref:Tetratricopeptide domain protein n=1 Tax=Pseudodesulfovibrio aespoeensis (strain ATCC 700646 / DSM 10631 / Aspo-2) TaxID=643562 RepID=E6VSR5_PSEA9|nr:tetratricopeptide domain protein [Pseudodesulfovibrio aespoeensis Aspo-2]
MLALSVWLCLVDPAAALRVNFASQGDSDRMTFSFDSSTLPENSVRRTGARELRVSLPASVWDAEPKPGSKDFPGKLVKSIAVDGDTVVITTQTDAIGFIRLPTPGKAEFVLQVFRDPIGARWKPNGSKPAAAAVPAPAAPTASLPAPAAIPQAAQPRGPEASETETDLPPESADGGDRKPFFAVPYTVRTEVAPPGDGGAQPGGEQALPQAVEAQPAAAVSDPQAQGAAALPQPAPPPQDGQYPASSELRFRAVNKTAEEVKFAELAGPQAGGAEVVEAVPVSVGDGSAVGGSVAPPPMDGQGPPVDVPVQDGEALPVPPSDGQVGGSVAPPSVVQGAPPPRLSPEEAAQVPPMVQVEPTPQADPVPAEVPPFEQPETGQNGTGQNGTGQDGVEDPLDPAVVAKAKEQELADKVYEAQSLMFNGKLDEALPLFEDILRMPEVPLHIREETLYAVADIKKQKYGNDLAGNFRDISQAFIEAMNINLRSNRVPSALLNLGLLNLQVNNFPEAKAYFKVLQDNYPDDDNIPSISYYWGEYYYKMGDYLKAADQFQYLIQTYPEHQLVKEAAYYLADSLNRTGFVEQAYQIVDYIDKRWPDYYMENAEFLRLAGGVEMALDKLQEAKNHYFTYYNLNPDSEGADVVLARIGDIYVRQGEKGAAKQIYERAVLDYPDKEGGLIARMRLAEEGIYDDPTMGDMVSVFDRPYNLRPEMIYQEIVERYPDSPLAPIAQLKLAMWHAFNKQYPEALGAAQDLIEKYPDSPLVRTARTLGDSVFALAVPGMVAEERFGRVVRYWETYDFIGKEDTKVDDAIITQVALSYWKVGKPEKALELIKPYLGKTQIPGVSDEALGLAVNIYLDQLAWKEIADLVAMARANWTLPPERLRQFEYAQAMSLQNLGNADKALAMWADLAKDVKVDPAFRAYAMYYMAKSAMDQQDLRRVFVYAQEALSLLLQTKGDPEKIKDAVLMSIYATERSGRYEEALKWAREYDRYIDVDNPEWASTRFKLARIYRKAGAIEEWKQLLGDIIEKKPDSLQAQLAKSALDTYDLEQKAQQYAPAPQ